MFFKNYQDNQLADQFLDALKDSGFPVNGDEYCFLVVWNDFLMKVSKSGFNDEFSLSLARKRTDRVIRVRNTSGGRFNKESHDQYGDDETLEVSSGIKKSIYETCVEKHNQRNL